MTILSATPSKVGINGEAEGKDKGAIQRSYTAEFFVQTDTVADQTKAILDYFQRTPTLPWIGRTLNILSTRDAVTCKKIAPKKDPNSPTAWTVSVTYDDSENKEEEKPDKNGKGALTNDPEKWNDEVSVSHHNIQEPVYRAIYRGGLGPNVPGGPTPGIDGRQEGQVMVPSNSAGVPFDPPLMVNTAIRVVRIGSWVPNFNGAAATEWMNVVNSQAFLLAMPWCVFADRWGQYKAKIEQIGGEFQLRNKKLIWHKVTEIHIHPRGWRVEVADRGRHQLARGGDYDTQGGTWVRDPLPGQPQVKRIQDRVGQPINEDILLDGRGQPLRVGASTNWITYQIYDEKAFNFGIFF
jgi:hypothetical protein